MKKKRTVTLRMRVTEVFVSIMAFVILMIWITNNWLLPRYYMNYKVQVLEQGYQMIDEMMSRMDIHGQSVLAEVQEELRRRQRPYGPDTKSQAEASENNQNASEVSPEAAEIVEMVNKLRDNSNISLYIFDAMGGNEIVASTRDKEFMRNKLMFYILGNEKSNVEVIRQEENYVIQRSYDPLRKNYSLESWGYFSDNGTVFMMTTPMDSIRESTSISTNFLMKIGFIAMFLGAIIIYLVTAAVTGPIHLLSVSSEKMSQLNFSEKFETETSISEIQTLGNSMNIMSERLEHTINELQEANAKLQRDIDEKIQIDEMRKDFIANVSHELKTPIALIQGYAEGLVEGMAEDPESRDYYCNVIQDEAQKMNKMVKQLITLSAIENGADKPDMETFDLVEVVSSCIETSGIVIRQKNVSVEFDAGSREQPVLVRGDEFKIEEVITNYLSNALNHVSEEGKIQIRIEEQMDDSDGRAIPVARVTVGNTGQTISPEAMDQLWTKFYKADKSRSRAYGGSGIGLSIVKAIMDGHGRRYGVQNVEDGVEFWFELETIINKV